MYLRCVNNSARLSTDDSNSNQQDNIHNQAGLSGQQQQETATEGAVYETLTVDQVRTPRICTSLYENLNVYEND